MPSGEVDLSTELDVPQQQHVVDSSPVLLAVNAICKDPQGSSDELLLLAILLGVQCRLGRSVPTWVHNPDLQQTILSQVN